MRIPSAIVSRRSALAAGAGLVAIAAAGCTPMREPLGSAPPSADDEAVGRAIAQARRLRADALALIASGASGRRVRALTAIAADHAAHLTALGSPAQASPGLTSPGPESAATTGPAGAPSTAPSSQGAPSSQAAPSSRGQLAGEWTAAREALADALTATDAGLAVLLTRIAAARAVHADLMAAATGGAALPALKPARPRPAPASSSSPSSTSSPSSSGSTSGSTTGSTTGIGTAASTGASAGPVPADPRWLAALDRMLAGEHAAVFAYPLIIAQLTGASRNQAEQLWQDHQTQRNQLTQVLVAAKAQPSAAAPAYDIGARLMGAGAARQLASAIELGLAALAADGVAIGQGAKERAYAATALVNGARRAASWSGTSVPLPGLPTQASPTGAPTATAQPTTQPPAPSASATSTPGTQPSPGQPTPTQPPATDGWPFTPPAKRGPFDPPPTPGPFQASTWASTSSS